MKLLYQKLSDIFGLSAYEAKVFLALCQFEKANISQISKASSIPRTAVYPSINSLLKKGLISIDILGKRKYYRALSPSQLEAIFEWKKRDLSSIITELSRNVPLNGDSIQVSYFPGKMGLNSAAETFLNSSKGKLWRTFESATVNQPALEFYQLQDYINRRVKKGIKAKVVMTINIMYPFLKERLNHDKEELRETLLISEKNFPLKVVIGINEDSILILSGEDVVFGAVIKNPQFAQTLSVIHEMVWERNKR